MRRLNISNNGLPFSIVFAWNGVLLKHESWIIMNNQLIEKEAQILATNSIERTFWSKTKESTFHNHFDSVLCWRLPIRC